jgi:carboxymethylenebutenolidase
MRARSSLPLAVSIGILSLAAAVLADTPATDHSPGGGAMDSASIAAMPRDPKLPAGELSAKAALDASPRHGEWVDVPLKDGVRLHTWIVYPERHDKAPVVLIIHEIFGLSDWIRAVADQLAREGFIAVAPDLVTGFGVGGGGTESLASRDDVVKAVHNITPEIADARLEATFDWATHLPSANGKGGSIGFCWGGGHSFSFACTRPDLKAAVVYYGVAPDSAMLLKIKAPVLGLYGGDDARVDATIDPARKVLSRAHRSYDPHVFDGAGHGFLRAQTQRDGANLRATQKAWPLTVDFLKKNLR